MLQSAAIMVPLYQVNVKLRLLNTHFAMIGPYVALGLPFAVLILRGFFEELPKALEDAALIDGASRFTIYWQILLPLTRPALITVGIFQGLASWNDFLLPMLFTSTSDMRTLPLGLLTFIQNNVVLRQEHRFALIVMMILPIVILFLLLQRQFIAGLTAGAVKE
jgi:multiple sugar transport system permease protein/raffinose/stachyose/melibiose transport system permease protein